MLPVETEVPQLYIKMAKEVAGLIKLQIRGGAANPSPPVGPCLLYTSPSPRDRQKSRMPSSA